MKAIPDTVKHYKSTTVFTEATLPAALQRAHTTAAGVWGRIQILEGRLLYRITDPRVQAEDIVLNPQRHGVVEPQVEHEVAVIGPVRFQVDFHR
jgi:tellurite resistance-related uncharacterized protein